MAWGAIMLRLPEGAKLEDLPNDYELPTIGTPEQIFSVLKNLFPNQEHELGQTNYYDDNCYVEFSYEKREIVNSISVRSDAGRNALSVMKIICNALGLALVDYQSGHITDLEQAVQENLSDYRDWVERVIP